MFYLPCPRLSGPAWHWMKSYVGDFSEPPIIFSSPRLLRPSGSGRVCGSHHFLITVLHQRDVPLVVILKLCVVGSGTGEFKKSIYRRVWSLTCWPLLRQATALEKALQKKAWKGYELDCYYILMRVDSPFLLGHLQGGEPDGVQVLLHPAHLVQGTPQVAHAVIKILV